MSDATLALSSRPDGEFPITYIGRYRAVWATLTGPTSYATGVSALDPTEVGLRAIHEVYVRVSTDTAGDTNADGDSVEVDVTDPTAPIYYIYTSNDTEPVDTTNVSDVIVEALLLGY